MSSKIPLQIFKSSSFRLSVWYAGFFIASSVLTLITSYFFLASTLKASDQQAILSELKELVSEYNTYGVAAFQQGIGGGKRDSDAHASATRIERRH
jgi:hypothetical protein